jgi:TRAP-type C4-dicarboxylate transport system permease small subunit
MNPAPQSGWSRPLVRLLEGMLMMAMGVLVLVVLWGVLSRGLGELKAWLETTYGIVIAVLPDGQSSWTEELARFLLIWTSLLGAALAFQRRAHLGVDYLIGKFHPEARVALRLVGHLLVLTFAGLVLVKGGWTLVDTTMSSGQVTPALSLKKWIVYSVIPISGIFVGLFTLEHLMADLKTRPGEEKG